MKLARIRRYVARAREAGIAANLRIVCSRLSGYLLYLPAAWNRLSLGLRPPPLFDTEADRQLQLMQPLFHVLWDGAELRTLRAVMQGDTRCETFARRAILRAELLLEGHISLLGWGSITVPMPPAWDTDIYRGVSWPASFHKAVDMLRMGEPCDVKAPWELSRLQFLVWLGQAWIVSADSKYLRGFWNLLRDWSLKNPVGYGVNWTCSMEVAIRAINISVAANLFCACFSEQEVRWIRKLLAQHYRHIHFNLELSDVTGNHYFFDLLGTATLAPVLYGPRSAAARAADAALLAEIATQFHADGVHIENASGYHRLMTEGLVFYLAYSRCQKIQERGELEGTVVAASRFLKALTVGDGEFPLVGDSDSGNLLLLGDARGNRVLYVTQSCDISLGLGGADGASTPKEESVWLLPAAVFSAAAGDVQPHQAQEIGRPELLSFPDGGYFMVRKEDHFVSIRCGTSGLRGRGSHDHNDQLSFFLRVFGKPIIIDPGTTNYTADVGAHERDLATFRHSTVLVNRIEQAPIALGSVTSTVRSAAGRCVAFLALETGVVHWQGTVDRYGGPSAGIVHSRSVEVLQMGRECFEMEITDVVSATTDKLLNCSAVFPMHPSWSVELAAGPAVKCRSGELCTMLSVEAGKSDIAIRKDQVSLEYGAVQPSLAIVATFSGKRIVQAVTRIRCDRNVS